MTLYDALLPCDAVALFHDLALFDALAPCLALVLYRALLRLKAS